MVPVSVPPWRGVLRSELQPYLRLVGSPSDFSVAPLHLLWSSTPKPCGFRPPFTTYCLRLSPISVHFVPTFVCTLNYWVKRVERFPLLRHPTRQLPYSWFVVYSFNFFFFFLKEFDSRYPESFSSNKVS